MFLEIGQPIDRMGTKYPEVYFQTKMYNYDGYQRSSHILTNCNAPDELPVAVMETKQKHQFESCKNGVKTFKIIMEMLNCLTKCESVLFPVLNFGLSVCT